jgi:peptidoglycan/LPS O-acetylase OafA/YrhL
MPGRPRAVTDRWIALDAMRGLAALLVVLYHLRWDWHGYDLVPVRHGFYAVDFFFVLSGFVMAATYGTMRTPEDLVRFAIKRAGRLLPLHFAVLAAFVTLELLFGMVAQEGLRAGRSTFVGFTALPALLAQATLTFGLIPGLDWLWNHPCWSIAVDFWTYMLFGLTVLVPRRHRVALWLGLSTLGLAAIASGPDGLTVTSGVAVFRCLLSFFLGALTHVSYAALRSRGVVLGTSLQIATTALALTMAFLPPEDTASLAIPLAFAAMILCQAFDEGGLAEALAVRPLVRLGELSFSIYLVHVPVWFALEGLLRLGAASGVPALLPDAAVAMPGKVSPLGSALAADVLALGYLAAVLAVAAWTQRRIEGPARLWSRRLADRSELLPTLRHCLPSRLARLVATGMPGRISE